MPHAKKSEFDHMGNEVLLMTMSKRQTEKWYFEEIKRVANMVSGMKYLRGSKTSQKVTTTVPVQ